MILLGYGNQSHPEKSGYYVCIAIYEGDYNYYVILVEGLGAKDEGLCEKDLGMEVDGSLVIARVTRNYPKINGYNFKEEIMKSLPNVDWKWYNG